MLGLRTMRDLHRVWLGDDAPTDVLSFPCGSPPPGVPIDAAPLGEVVICVPFCEQSAGERGIPLHEEIARVMIHGTLHLLGYDHVTAEQARRMRPREARYHRWYRLSGLEVTR